MKRQKREENHIFGIISAINSTKISWCESVFILAYLWFTFNSQTNTLNCLACFSWQSGHSQRHRDNRILHLIGLAPFSMLQTILYTGWKRWSGFRSGIHRPTLCTERDSHCTECNTSISASLWYNTCNHFAFTNRCIW